MNLATRWVAAPGPGAGGFIVITPSLLRPGPASSSTLQARHRGGVSLLRAGARRTSCRGCDARRGLSQSRRETAAVSQDRDDLIGPRDTARGYAARAPGGGTTRNSLRRLTNWCRYFRYPDADGDRTITIPQTVIEETSEPRLISGPWGDPGRARRHEVTAGICTGLVPGGIADEHS